MAVETILRKRTKEFAIRVIRLVNSLPRTPASNAIGNQLLRSATSIGANYRAAQRGRSPAEFRAKLGIAEEEADESVYWIELLIESGNVKESLLKGLQTEGNELVAMIVASIRTSKAKAEQ